MGDDNNSVGNKTRTDNIAFDFEKAYDKVDWNFLYEVMGRLGLPSDYVMTLKTIYDIFCLRNATLLGEPRHDTVYVYIAEVQDIQPFIAPVG